MLGKPHWFQRRKYGGWGVYPKTWQGWVYVAAMVAILFLVQYLPLDYFGVPSASQAKTVLMLVFAAAFALDLIHIMARLPRDERDRIHEAIAERNALWAVIAALTAGIGWQAAVSAVNRNLQVDPVIIIAIVAGVLVKAASNIYLDRKN